MIDSVEQHWEIRLNTDNYI